MPKININNLEPSSTYRLYLRGEQHNLPFIDIKTPKVIVKSDVKNMISTVKISKSPDTAATANITIPGLTASAASLLYIEWSMDPGVSKNAINRFHFVAPPGNYSGDWATYINLKSPGNKYAIASLSYGGQSDNTASIVFGSLPQHQTKIDSGSLRLIMDFTSLNKDSTRSKVNFAITSTLTAGNVANVGSASTTMKGGYIGNTTLIEPKYSATPNTSALKLGAALKPLLNTLNLRVTDDTLQPENSSKELEIQIIIDDTAKLQLKNSSTIKDILIPIYKMRKSDGTYAGGDNWFICPIKGTNNNNYQFYAPVMFDNVTYGTTPTEISTSSLNQISQTPPQTFKTFNGYGIVTTSANFFQPIYISDININNIDILNLNSGLPSQYNIPIYLGYPDNICNLIKIAFVVARYKKVDSSWVPDSWIPGVNNSNATKKIAFISNIYDIERQNFESYTTNTSISGNSIDLVLI